MTLKEINENIQDTNPKNLKLYFITRSFKEGVNRRSRVMDKYDFQAFHIDIDDAIRDYLYGSTIATITKESNKNMDIVDYCVIAGDIKTIFSYAVENKALSFMSVLNEQLPNKVSKIDKIESLVTDNRGLWAYCIGFENEETNEWIYTFRKMLRGKATIDDKTGKNVVGKILRTFFSTKSLKLEPVVGDTINLDDKVDCIYCKDKFYVVSKDAFEKILCLEEEYKEEAFSVLEELKKTDMIIGLDILFDKIKTHPPIHKKLVSISRIGNYRGLNARIVRKMKSVCKKHKVNLNIKDGKLCIESDVDIDIVLKMLADYYKTGEVSGKSYGTFAGKEVKVNLNIQ
ncbi:MAG: DUF4868 domain-containing protein [bacterium]